MVLEWKLKVVCSLQVVGAILPQVEEFKYLRVLFTSGGTMEGEMDRQIGAAAAVKWSLYRSVVVKKELSRNGKALHFLVHLYSNSPTYCHELWVTKERVRSWI